MFLLFEDKKDNNHDKKRKQNGFPPPPFNHRYASGSGVSGTQKSGDGESKSRSSGELGLEEGGAVEDDDPDI